MSYMPTEPFVPGDDREHRDRRLLRATIWCAQIGEQDILIRNFSRRGLGGSTSRSPVSPGIEVTVTLPTGLQMTGTVRWARENAFGMRLTNRLTLLPLQTTFAGRPKLHVQR